VSTETIACPYCGSNSNTPWDVEHGFTVVRCECRLLFVNPRPKQDLITQAVQTGVHAEETGGANVVTRRIASKVDRYEKVLREVFADVWAAGRPISWVDVGAGFGEFIEAVGRCAPAGSEIEGLEPMGPKAQAARERGLNVVESYLTRDHAPVDFVSSIDVFSHIPDYRPFLQTIADVLKPGGEVFLETGNLADVERRDQFPNELGVPDHLVFAGEEHMRGYLDQCGFDVVSIKAERYDDAITFAKTVVKKMIGRPVIVSLPYTSNYRQLLIRARKR
jgi:SAM-dependent methyltransferase